MPVLSVITATRGDHALHEAPWAKDAWDSLNGQHLPDGWEFEWLVQADGDAAAARAYVRDAGALDDERVFASGIGHQAGAATCRTTALVRARGSWICILDDDDILPKNSLAARIHATENDPTIAWVTGRVMQTNPDGTKEVLPRAPSRTGLFTPDDVLRELPGNSCFPAYPMTLLARTDAVWAVGAWGPMPIGEDNILLSGLTSCFTGWCIEEPVYGYRRRTTKSLTSGQDVPDWSAIHRPAQFRRALAAAALLKGHLPHPPHPVTDLPPGHVHGPVCEVIGCSQA